MKRIPRSAQCLAVLLLFFAAAIPSAVLSEGQTPQSLVDGRRLFKQSCEVCHDTLGTGRKPGPRLKNYYRSHPRPADSAVREIILQGKGKMPGFSTFSKSQMNDLVEYLKTL